MKTPHSSHTVAAPISRRKFLAGTSAATAAITIVPRHVLGGAKHVPPSEKIHLAYIGCGTQGLRQLMPALENGDIRIWRFATRTGKAMITPSGDRNELNDKMRNF